MSKFDSDFAWITKSPKKTRNKTEKSFKTYKFLDVFILEIAKLNFLYLIHFFHALARNHI